MARRLCGRSGVSRGFGARYVSLRERRKAGMCEAMLQIRLPISIYPDFQRHQCELVKEHYGVHLCWCGSAFNDRGELFTQKRLPEMDA